MQNSISLGGAHNIGYGAGTYVTIYRPPGRWPCAAVIASCYTVGVYWFTYSGCWLTAADNNISVYSGVRLQQQIIISVYIPALAYSNRTYLLVYIPALTYSSR